MKNLSSPKTLTLTAIVIMAMALACKTLSPEGKTLSSGTDGAASYYNLANIPGRYIGRTAKVVIDTGNTSSFHRKLEAIKAAQKSIDIQYFIFGDYGNEHDYTSAIAMRELLAKAKEGVKVRIIVDDGTTRKWRDDFTGLKNEAIAVGAGDNLRIAYYRPFQLPNNHPLKYAETLFLEVQNRLKNTNISPQAFLTVLLKPSTVFPDFATASFDPVKSVRLVLASRQLFIDSRSIENNGLDAFGSTLVDVFGRNPSTGTYAGFWAKLFSTALQRPVSEQQVMDMINLLKRSHHKLLVVDGHFVSGGGRNMWDISHLDFNHKLRPENLKHDYDADYMIDDAKVGTAVLASFNDYWDCLANKACKAGTPMSEETGTVAKAGILPPGRGETAATAEKARLAELFQKRILADAAEYEQRINEPLRTAPMLKTVIEAHDAEVAYSENKMWKNPNPGPNGPSEIPSDILAAWVQLINATPAGKTVMLHNAYFLLPTEVLVAVIKAIQRGVKFVYVTTGREQNDTSLLSDLMRMQSEALMSLFEKAGKKDVIEIYEAYAFQQSHTKVSAIGDYLVVGSANADSRSAYLNTENVMVIGPGQATWNGRTFASASEAYQTWVLSEVQNPANAKRFRKVDLAKIRQDFAALPNAAALQVLRDWFAISVRVGLEIDKGSDDFRDRKTTGQCRNNKEGFNQVGCSMREWLYEQLFLQL